MSLCGQQFRRHRVGGEHFLELPKLAQPVYNPINGSNVSAFGVPTSTSVPSPNTARLIIHSEDTIQFLIVPQLSIAKPKYGFLTFLSGCNQLASAIGQ